MSAKMGRPTNDPKTIQTMFRLSQYDMKILSYCAETTGRSKADIIREGIRIVYERLKKK